MDRQVVIITGAAGFLGSAITVDLSADHTVVAFDRRRPSVALLEAAPQTVWHQGDVADADTIEAVFRQTEASFGRVDFVVHFAAFYHFGTEWLNEYERTNLQGTSHVLRSAGRSEVQRVIFASSSAAMRPTSCSTVLTEKTPTDDYIPYAKTKALGEQMLREVSDRLPGIVLRIGGAFSDWCELPPLYSLIKLWAGRSPLRRLVVGQGMTGMPYIHRDDVVRVVRSCIERHATFDRCEVLLASQHGAVTHNDLFTAIGQSAGETVPEPIFIAPWLAKIGLRTQHVLGRLTGRVPFERPWMLRYVDRPWVTDTTNTERKLGFRPAEGLGVLDRLPAMLEHYRQDRRIFEHRNQLRAAGQYAYYAAEG